jgi:hypothetical protein
MLQLQLTHEMAATTEGRTSPSTRAQPHEPLLVGWIAGARCERHWDDKGNDNESTSASANANANANASASANANANDSANANANDSANTNTNARAHDDR